MRPGVALTEVNADLLRLVPLLLERFPLVGGFTPQMFRNLALEPNVVTLKDAVVGDLGDVLWVLLGTIGILLLIACANVANLQLVRTEGRAQELAIRAALGASAARVAGGLLLESTLLGLVAGALGVAVAAMVLPALLALAAAQLPQALVIAVDPTVLAFALAVSVGSGLLFGAVPVLRYAGPRVARLLVATGRAHTASRDRRRVQRGLVVGQVALALVLLIASGL
jgi:hypothetical protein